MCITSEGNIDVALYIAASTTLSLRDMLVLREARDVARDHQYSIQAWARRAENRRALGIE